MSKAIENLQNFTLDADPSFRHFQLDVSKELKLLTELNFIQGERGSDDEEVGEEKERLEMKTEDPKVVKGRMRPILKTFEAQLQPSKADLFT